MRNSILVAVAAVAFCAAGIALPNVLIAQDAVEENLESDSPVALNRHNSDGDMQNQRENFRDRERGDNALPEDPPGRRESFRDRGQDLRDSSEDRRGRREDYQDRRRNRSDSQRDFQGRRGYRGDHRKGFWSHRGDRRSYRSDFRGHRGFGRDHKRDFEAQRKVQRDHKRYYSSRLDHRKPYFAKRHRYKHSDRAYRGGRWSIAHRR